MFVQVACDVCTQSIQLSPGAHPHTHRKDYLKVLNWKPTGPAASG